MPFLLPLTHPSNPSYSLITTILIFSLNISFGETVSACLGLDKLHLTSAENFWAEVLATETSNGSGVSRMQLNVR